MKHKYDKRPLVPILDVNKKKKKTKKKLEYVKRDLAEKSEEFNIKYALRHVKYKSSVGRLKFKKAYKISTLFLRTQSFFLLEKRFTPMVIKAHYIFEDFNLFFLNFVVNRAYMQYR